MYGSGPLDGDDDNYKPPSIPSMEEQNEMVEQRRKADEKLREKERNKRRRAEMKENIKGSIERVGHGVKSFFNRNNRSSRPNTAPTSLSPSQAAYNLFKDGRISRVGGSKRKRKRRNRTARKPKKRSKRTRRHKR